MSAIVCKGNWDYTVDVDELHEITPVSMGPRHNPINHGEMLTRFVDRANAAGVKVTSETGIISPDKTRYMYVADIAYDSLKSDFAFTVGFINFNDRSRSFTPIAGQRVFMCSNLSITNTLEESRARHSTNVDNRIDARIDEAFSKFDEMFRIQMANVDAMKAAKLTDELVGKFMLESTRRNLMGATNLRRVVEEIDNPTLNNHDDNSAWRLHNAASFVLRENIKNPIIVADTTRIANNIITQLVV